MKIEPKTLPGIIDIAPFQMRSHYEMEFYLGVCCLSSIVICNRLLLGTAMFFNLILYGGLATTLKIVQSTLGPQKQNATVNS